MKHCPKPVKEPECLERFRKNDPGATWEDFKGEDRSCYSDLRNNLHNSQGGLCAYCEMFLNGDNQQIAHFHPKSDDRNGPTNWALSWSNMWLACRGGTQLHHKNNPHQYYTPISENRSCDENKDNMVMDEDILSPGDIPIAPRIFRYKQSLMGILIEADEDGCKQAGVPVEKVVRTIKVFNLNCTRLVRARLDSFNGIEEKIKIYQNSPIIDYKNILELFIQTHLAKNESGHWPKFFTLIRWRFSTLAEEYLLKINYQG